MVDRIQLVSFGITSIIILLLTLSDAKPCDIKADVCEYKFIVAYRLTMMNGKHLTKAVDGKLYNVQVVNTSAANPVPIDDVISLDGYPYSHKVVAVNGTIPGPAIEVYLGQTVIINVENQLYTSSITIHWHGLEQKGTPFMDGVPYVTQCPIGPSQSFTYKFNVTQTGTYWYHSHMGTQRSRGLYGAFIIRNRASVSMPEHLMVVTDYNHDWDSDTDQLKMMYGMYVKQKKLTNTYSFDKAHFSLFNFQSGLVNGRGRFYSSPGVHNGGPIAKFTVKQGTQYRFRVIAAGVLYPFQISVDGHKLQIVSSDGSELEPRTFDIFIINPGERFDFIITANQTPGNYWIRGKTTEIDKNHTFEAILHYDGINNEEPNSANKICSQNAPCNVLNCPFSFYPMNEYKDCTILSEMNSAFDYEVPRIKSGKWKEYFLNFAFPGEPGHTPASINGRQYVQPSVNPLYQPDEVSTLCDKQDCGVDRVCSCTHSLKLKRGDTVQMIFLNMGSGKGFDHPVHMHGHSFSVVKMGYPTYNMSTGAIMSVNPDIDCRGDPEKNYCNDAAWSNSNWGGDNIPGLKLKKAPLKDTLIIPSGGYAVIRIKADNPGLWFMHCHIEIHNVDGMAMFLNESFADVPEAPDHFPVCWSFTPEEISRIPTRFDVTTPLNQDRNSQDIEISKTGLGILIAIICILVAILIILIIVIVRKISPKSSQVGEEAVNLGFVEH